MFVKKENDNPKKPTHRRYVRKIWKSRKKEKNKKGYRKEKRNRKKKGKYLPREKTEISELDYSKMYIESRNKRLRGVRRRRPAVYYIEGRTGGGGGGIRRLEDWQIYP